MFFNIAQLISYVATLDACGLVVTFQCNVGRHVTKVRRICSCL